MPVVPIAAKDLKDGHESPAELEADAQLKSGLNHSFAGWCTDEPGDVITKTVPKMY